MKKNLLTLVLIFIYTISSYAQAPTITSFTPASGPVGTLVTITGTNLSSPTIFSIGGVAAIKVSGTATSLVGMVMPGVATGAVSVTTAAGTAAGGSSFTVIPTGYPSMQQGNKLVGTGAVSYPAWGSAVSVSADGNTAVVGGYNDNNQIGGVWIYTRNGSTWSQQGARLLGTGAVGATEQGGSVAISADGNTVIWSGVGDNNYLGAAWVFVRSGGIWTQQGNKLSGSGATSGAQQGSVSISADGNTAILGAFDDNTYTGAAWIFTRSGGIWTQQGNKLVGTGAIGTAQQGASVALSGDGNTAIVGGPGDSTNTGAAWIYTRSGNVWAQQTKLVGTGAVDSTIAGFTIPISQGGVVALSADGNTAIIGGVGDNLNAGAAWVFKRTGSSWVQQGSKLVGTGALGGAGLGGAVSLSADGNTAAVGGYFDSSGMGATWVFTCSGSTWTQRCKLVGTGVAVVGTYLPGQGKSVALSADGTTLIEGGYQDNNQIGAAWVFSADSSAIGPPCSADTSTVSLTICRGNTYVFGGSSLSASGIYGHTFTNTGGCDSLVILQLLVLDSSTAYFYLQPADSPHVWYIVLPSAGNNITYTWNWGDGTGNTSGDTATHTYASAGYYNICLTVTDSAGCFATYCDTGVQLFKNQAGQMIHVKVIKYPAGINEINTSVVKIFPNPAAESFTLSVNAEMIGTSYTFTDITGRIIHSHVVEKENTVIFPEGLSSGIYILQIDGRSYKVVKE